MRIGVDQQHGVIEFHRDAHRQARESERQRDIQAGGKQRNQYRDLGECFQQVRFLGGIEGENVQRQRTKDEPDGEVDDAG